MVSRMFGTFQPLPEDQEIVYGLVDQPQSYSVMYLEVGRIQYNSFLFYYINARDEHFSRFFPPHYCARCVQTFYFVKLYKKFKSMDGWKNKLYSLIKGPGWTPGSPWTGNPDNIPDVSLIILFNFNKYVHAELHTICACVTD